MRKGTLPATLKPAVSRDVPLYLVDDMIEACRRIGQYTNGLARAQFVSGTMAHDAVLRNLEVLGEAAKNVRRARPRRSAHQRRSSLE